MKKPSCKTQVLPGVFLLCCIILGYYNYFKYDDFFKTPFTTIISIIIAVVVSYYFVQKKNDTRLKKEKIDKLLYKIQEIILDDNFLSTDNENAIRKNLILHRSVANKIKYVCEKLDAPLVDDMKKVEETFENLREFYSAHYSDSDYMLKSIKEITNFKTIIDDTCDKIHMELL